MATARSKWARRVLVASGRGGKEAEVAADRAPDSLGMVRDVQRRPRNERPVQGRRGSRVAQERAGRSASRARAVEPLVVERERREAIPGQVIEPPAAPRRRVRARRRRFASAQRKTGRAGYLATRSAISGLASAGFPSKQQIVSRLEPVDGDRHRLGARSPPERNAPSTSWSAPTKSPPSGRASVLRRRLPLGGGLADAHSQRVVGVVCLGRRRRGRARRTTRWRSARPRRVARPGSPRRARRTSSVISTSPSTAVRGPDRLKRLVSA